MKKVFILLVMLFIITGCDANYNLTFEDGVFTEDIEIKEEKNSSGNELFGIMSLKDNKELAKIDDNNYYNYTFSSDDKNNILRLNFKYDNISLEKSLVYQNCFKYKNFIDGKNYYYIKLEGDMICENLNSSDIIFKTDKKVFMDNADEKDEEKGIYKWNNFKSGTIYFQVSKDIKIDEAKESKKPKELIPWFVKVIISVVIIGVIFILIRKIKERE